MYIQMQGVIEQSWIIVFSNPHSLSQDEELFGVAQCLAFSIHINCPTYFLFKSHSILKHCPLLLYIVLKKCQHSFRVTDARVVVYTMLYACAGIQ